ncbi:MAG TPA: M48 family metalloprotease [Alphaproteobacteria bacterium]|jgi:predicted Zn-dependent protease
MKIRLALLTAAAFAAQMPAEAALAQSRGAGLALIRDAEIEHTIRAYSAPIFQAAGLSTAKIQVHLVNDGRLNAFVAGGRHMFINTGLLMRAEHAGQVIGVIAHETGHIVGGHLVRLQRELQDAQIKQIISMILSMGAAVAARDGRIAAAGTALGARLTEGAFYQFTQTQESAADSFGLTALDRAGISARGLFEFLQILGEQEMLYAARQDPYLRTHPITRERIDKVRQHLAHSPLVDRPLPKAFEAMHIRMRAKLIGFLRPPEQVIARYQGKENTLEARYALAVAYHQDARLERALQFIDGLIKESPNDPYFHELRGQILFESGGAHIREAVAAFERAARLAPGEALIRVGLAQAQLETGDSRLHAAALENLRAAVRRDDTYPLAWRLLSVAYGKAGDIGNSALANAEYAYLNRDLPTLRAAIPVAERGLKPGTPAWLRLQDLKAQVTQILDDRRR